MDIFGKAAFSQHFGCCDQLEPSEAAVAFELLGVELAKRLSNPLWISNYFYSFPTEANRKHREARVCLRSLLKKAIVERQGYNASPKRDFLALIVEASNELKRDCEGNQEKERDVDQMLSDTMMAILFAGYDTTSITLTYALYLLSQHPEIEKHCLEEIESSPEDLIYCKGVIMETLRMYPPATIVPRTLLQPIKISGGFVVPEGTQVFIPVWLIQQDPKLFPRPDEFRPDRWVRREGPDRWVEREETDMSSSDVPPAFRKAFFAFSGGARSCPGQRFAIQEAVVVLAGILKDFKFSTVPGYVLLPARSGLTQRPRGGLPMRIQLRSPPTK
jgi:cytochrome P450